MDAEQSSWLNFTPVSWLQFRPEMPSIGELVIIFLYAGGLILVGKLFKSQWERNNETVPLPVAVGMGAAMLGMGILLISVFYFRASYLHETDLVVRANDTTLVAVAPDGAFLGILGWCMFAMVFPLFYYGLIIVNAFTAGIIDRVSPFGMQIHEPSEFAEARKMALRGDIDGAVKRYRAYLDNSEGALFEAARLLKSEDRFAEAAALFLEIKERFFGKKLVWAEATYQLAKLRESNLHQAGEAIALLDQVVARTPDSRFGQLAMTELTRMRALYTGIEPTPDLSVIPDTDDPFYSEDAAPEHREAPAQRPTPADNGRSNNKADSDELSHVPSVDPFFAASQLRREALEAEEAAEAAADKPAPKRKKAAAKKKPAAKKKAAPKKAAAKKKPAAKRKAAPKKKSDSSA